MRRRQFIHLVAMSSAWPLVAHAQRTPASSRVVKIGVLWHAGSADEEKVYLDILTKAFSDLGYVDGKNVVFLHRFPAEQPERFRQFAKDLVEERADVILAVTQRGAMELRRATSAIPVVLVLGVNPVSSGLIESLAHPGGNVTGLSVMTLDTSGKRLGLLKEAVPTLKRVALLIDTNDPVNANLSSYLSAAKALGLKAGSVEVPTPDAIETAFSSVAGNSYDAALVMGSMLFNERERVGKAALAHRIPAGSVIAEMVPHGLLMSYGQDFPDFFRKAASYVDKILKGAKPADLPVEQPTRFKLVINLKVANALNLALPPTLLASADEVIE
ncbi:ABC transporter substrate-binding protein [Bradyrhizobium sp. sBnM-33]|uniref:ABC transporter substrate-binding protein n=1 Tax=Bradyrhizobium sp. sBnM-33 TaxID=2831780 RepID=UPI001BCF4150|nr:ABC transporter substrate-binding protein [Bradyrhizobium sp. sBnM-33]WOH48209.1 ABC transporter substrate-binding protein [Bradyrhizobium sp. sBnM-33]